MPINAEWHSKHKLPDHPSLDQKVNWHIEHARRCPCGCADEEILEELKKRFLNTHQDFWIFFHVEDHKALALWAAREEDAAARFAARAAGQAVATAHAPTHALGPVLYAYKAVAAAHPGDAKTAIAQEKDWQFQRLPVHLREWAADRLRLSHVTVTLD